jgi:hypothetical protein
MYITMSATASFIETPQTMILVYTFEFLSSYHTSSPFAHTTSISSRVVITKEFAIGKCCLLALGPVLVTSLAVYTYQHQGGKKKSYKLECTNHNNNFYTRTESVIRCSPSFVEAIAYIRSNDAPQYSPFT